MTVWVVRAGGRGEWEELFTSEAIAAIHFSLRRSVTDFDGREELRAHMIESGGSRSGADQLWRFVHEIRNGDMVVLPRKLSKSILVGRVSGDYAFRTGMEAQPQHSRPVDWMAQDVSRADFDQDLLYSFGGLATVFRVQASDAETRIQRKLDQISGATPSTPASGIVGDEEEEFKVDLEEQINDRIIEHIRRKFSGHGLENLVAAILRASGYHALETRKGPDGGTDIVAGRGEMGFEQPRLCVQVKSGRDRVDISEYNRLQANIANIGAQHGLLVSLSGFTTPVHKENERSFFQIRLWGPNELVDRLLDTYDRLPEDIKSEIPIRTRGILIETNE